MNVVVGKVAEIIGAVVDVEFPRDAVPEIYNALRIEDQNLVLEVQQQLGDGIVRTNEFKHVDGFTDTRTPEKPNFTAFCKRTN